MDGALAGVLMQSVYIEGANVPFGELTPDQVRARADELRAATGWGPTARVGAVALAWRELALAMQKAQAGRVDELPEEMLTELAPRLWVVMPT
ncbi:MAG TPA: hypothetical protein VMP89_05700 [Solirubrobacteraceae bacterium]|nr:hypothetical protein [Solirubrobacteraceae bacterium]